MSELNHALKKNKNMSGFKGHFMADKEEYQRELYITLLSGIAQHLGSGDKKTEFLHKLAMGINLDDYEKYLKKSQSINEEFFDEIIRNFKGDKAGETLLTDALILANLDGDFNDKASVFISKIFDLFETGKAKTSEIVEKTKYALTHLKDDECDNYPVMLDNIISGKIIADKKETWNDDAVFLNCEVDFRDSGKLVFNAQNIKFINCRLLSPVMEFSGAGNIEIKNCEIMPKAGRKEYMNFNECASVLIEESRVKDIKLKSEDSDFINFNKIEKLRIIDNEFEGCSSSPSYLLSIESSNSVEIKENRFERCSSSSYSSLLSIKSSNSVEIKENRFERCGSSYSSYSSYLLSIESSNSVEIKENRFERCGFYYLLYIHSNTIAILQNKFTKCKSGYCVYLSSIESGGKIEKNEFEECEWAKDVYSSSSNVEIIE